jgi:hypothetical protein
MATKSPKRSNQLDKIAGTSSWGIILRILVLLLGIFSMAVAQTTVVIEGEEYEINNRPPQGWERRVVPLPASKKHGKQATVVVTRLPSLSQSRRLSEMVSKMEKEIFGDNGLEMEAYQLAARLIEDKKYMDQVVRDMRSKYHELRTKKQFPSTLRLEEASAHRNFQDIKYKRYFVQQQVDAIDEAARMAKKIKNDYSVKIPRAKQALDAFSRYPAARTARLHTGTGGGMSINLTIPGVAMYGVVTEDGHAPLFPVVSNIGKDSSEQQAVTQLAVVAHALGRAAVADTLRLLGPQAAGWMERRLRSTPVFILEKELIDMLSSEHLGDESEAYFYRRPDIDFGMGIMPGDHIIVSKWKNKSMLKVYKSMVHEIMHSLWKGWEQMANDPAIDKRGGLFETVLHHDYNLSNYKEDFENRIRDILKKPRSKLLTAMKGTEQYAASILEKAGATRDTMYAMKKTLLGRYEEIPTEAVTARAGAHLKYPDTTPPSRRPMYDLLAHHIGKHFEDELVPHFVATIRHYAAVFDETENTKKSRENKTTNDPSITKKHNNKNNNNMTIETIERVPNIIEYQLSKDDQNTLYGYIENYLKKINRSLKDGLEELRHQMKLTEKSPSELSLFKKFIANGYSPSKNPSAYWLK